MPGKTWGSIGSSQTTPMPPPIFPHRVWGSIEAGWASPMHPRPCATRCHSGDPLAPAEPTKCNLQERTVGVGETFPLLLSVWGCEEKHSPRQREKLPLVPRLCFSPRWSPNPVLTIHGGTPSGVLRSFPILLSSWEILVKNSPEQATRDRNNNSLLQQQLPLIKIISFVRLHQDLGLLLQGERGKPAAWSLGSK